MKIMMVFDNYPRRISSAEHFYISLAKELKIKGHELVFVFSDDPIPQFTRELKKLGYNDKTYSMKFRPYWSYLYNLTKIILTQKPDIIHGNFVPIYFPINLIGFFQKTKFVYTHHGPYLDNISIPKRILLQIFSTLFDLNIKKIIFVSDYLLKKHIDYNSPRKDNLIMIHNGIDLIKYGKKFDRQSFRKSLGINKNETLLLCVSHLMHFKGIQYLIDSLKSLDKINYKLLIVGEGSYESKLKKQVKMASLFGQVKFLGNRNDVDKIVRSSDIFIMPSVIGEGLPYTIMEAMAAARPIIATDAGGIPELIEDKKTGILIKQKNSDDITKALTVLISDKSLCRQLGSNAKKRIFKYFDQKRVISDYIDIYESI